MRVLQTLALPLGHDAMFKITERAMGFEPTTFSLARRRTTTVLRPQSVNVHRECRDTESNCGHRDFQSRALPTELSRRYSVIKRAEFYFGRRGLSSKVVLRAERNVVKSRRRISLDLSLLRH